MDLTENPDFPRDHADDIPPTDVQNTEKNTSGLSSPTIALSMPESCRALMEDDTLSEHMSPTKMEEGGRDTASIPPTLSPAKACHATSYGNSGRQSLTPTIPPESPTRSNADKALTEHMYPAKIEQQMEEEEDHEDKRGTALSPPTLSPAKSCHATSRWNSGRQSLSSTIQAESPARSNGSTVVRDGAPSSPTKSISPTVRLTDDGTQIVPSQDYPRTRRTKCDDVINRRHALPELGIKMDSQPSQDKSTSSAAMQDAVDAPCGDDPLPNTSVAAQCAPPEESEQHAETDNASLSPTQPYPPPRASTNASASYWTYAPTSPRMKRQLTSPGSAESATKRVREDLFGSMRVNDPLQTTQVKVELPTERGSLDHTHTLGRRLFPGNDESGKDAPAARLNVTGGEDSAFLDIPEREDARVTQVIANDDVLMPPAVVGEGGDSAFLDIPERGDQDAPGAQVSMGDDALMPPPVVGVPTIPEAGLHSATQMRVNNCKMMPPPRVPMKCAAGVGSVASRDSAAVDSATEPRESASDSAIVPVDLFQTQIPCFDDMSTTEPFPADPFETQVAYGFDLSMALCALPPPPPPRISLPVSVRRSDHLVLFNPPRPSTTALVASNSVQGNGSEDFILPTKCLYSRKKAAPTTPQVFLFTGNENHKDAQYQFKAMFKNVTVAEDWSNEVTHIIAQGPPLKRTSKVLCGVCKGLPVLSIQYIQRCLRMRRLVSEENYQFEELTEARQRALQNPLLVDFRAVYIFPSVKNRMQWQEAVEAAGGTFRRSFPGKSELCEGILLLGMPSDAAVLKRRKIRMQLFSFEMLREALVSQVLDFEKHELVFE
eukprot:GEMP01011908.1.p1 GENE.GEMP01011908.1~~GEMP01011908.1.p1  ORF type:complete len:831 (+),score=226.60 GEMP01011908.1:80-2572(+)